MKSNNESNKGQENVLESKNQTVWCPLDLTYNKMDDFRQINVSQILMSSRETNSQDDTRMKSHRNEKTPPHYVAEMKTNKANKLKYHDSKIESRGKVSRKLKFDDLKSPVSGTLILPMDDKCFTNVQSGDIDPLYNIVEVTEEAKAEIAAIDNQIGDYNCKLCHSRFEDAFELARHKCSRIVFLEYRCKECGKKFNCPANLASHARWHQPRMLNPKRSLQSTNKLNICIKCNKTFKRETYLKKHLLKHSNDITFELENGRLTDLFHNNADGSKQKSHQPSEYEDTTMEEKYFETYRLTEEESIAATALTSLRHGF